MSAAIINFGVYLRRVKLQREELELLRAAARGDITLTECQLERARIQTSIQLMETMKEVA